MGFAAEMPQNCLTPGRYWVILTPLRETTTQQLPRQRNEITYRDSLLGSPKPQRRSPTIKHRSGGLGGLSPKFSGKIGDSFGLWTRQAGTICGIMCPVIHNICQSLVSRAGCTRRAVEKCKTLCTRRVENASRLQRVGGRYKVVLWRSCGHFLVLFDSNCYDTQHVQPDMRTVSKRSQRRGRERAAR